MKCDRQIWLPVIQYNSHLMMILYYKVKLYYMSVLMIYI